MKSLLTLLLMMIVLVVGSADAQLNIILDDANLRPAEIRGEGYIQGNAEYQRVPDNIIRTPDFEKLRDLPPDSIDYQLSEKVGWIIIPHPTFTDQYQYCTGFLVGPDLFLTNHHCIHDNFGALPLDGVQVFMDYYQDSSTDPTRGGITAGVSAILQADFDKDYALLRLDIPIGNIYGYLELDTTGIFDSSQSVKMISHPRGRSKEIVRRNSEIVDIPAEHPLSTVPFAIAYLADTEPGSSGSPVFLRDGSTVIGIHHSAWIRRGQPVFNAGTLMAHIVPEIQAWLPTATATFDLTAVNPRISKGYAQPSESLTISVSVVNQGSAASIPTTVRFYQSFDPHITADDTEIGTAFVEALQPNENTEARIGLLAPGLLGTYYYGACVDSNDPRGDNNCSASVLLTVSSEPQALKMYWTEGGNLIKRANIDGSEIETLVEWIHGLDACVGIVLDISAGKMYWTDQSGGRILRSNLDGSEIETLVETGEHNLHGIKLDLQGSKIYWSVSGIGLTRTGRIQRSNLDGSEIETLVTGLADPTGIALDMSAGKMYWILLFSGIIQRANLDGSDLEDVTEQSFGGISTAIAIDASAGKLYWSSNRGEIQRANLDGTDIESIVFISDDILDIALHTEAGKIYWVDLGSIQRANLDGSEIETLVTGLNFAFGIALGIPQQGISQPPPPTHPPFPPPDDPATLDVNGDGIVNILDLIWVSVFYGQSGPDLPADVNNDGIVNVQDFVAVAAVVDTAGALPIHIVEAILEQVEAIAGAPSVYNNIVAAFADTDSEILRQLLSRLPQFVIPETTALLPNYPNPFNPETWIPYQLSQPAEVSITIYAVNGEVVRHLPIGYQPAGIYHNKHRAAYWDGRTESNEPVASGIYFYTLTTGDYRLTRKMLIRK